MIAFVDTSVVLRFVLEGDIALHQAFAAPTVACSELLWIEAMRVVQRHRLNGALNDATLAEAVGRIKTCFGSFKVYLLDDRVKRIAAGPFPTAIGTLDALHVATAKRFADECPDEILLLYSYDNQMNVCARSMGWTTPLSG